MEASASGARAGKDKDTSSQAAVITSIDTPRIDVADGSALTTTWGAAAQAAAEEQQQVMPTPRGQPPAAAAAVPPMLQPLGSMKRGAAAPPLALAQLRASLVMDTGGLAQQVSGGGGGALQPSLSSPRGRPSSGQGIKPLAPTSGQLAPGVSGGLGVAVWDASLTSPPSDGGGAQSQRHGVEGAHLGALKAKRAGEGATRDGLSSPRTSQFLPALGGTRTGK